MHMMTDEEILYNCYMKIAEEKMTKSNTGDASKDKEYISEIAPKLSLTLMRLTSTDIRPPLAEMQKYILDAKRMYEQYSKIIGRHPYCVSGTMTVNMNKLIKAVCRHEADMISLLRAQETGGDRIDIQSIFYQKKNRDRLKNTLARTIVSEAIHDEANPITLLPTYYITDTGKKFHRADCPYCKGKNLSATTQKIVENLNLSPCKCLSELSTVDDVNHTCVTAFIDESIHPVMWNKEGKKGHAGSYSYILCWGNLSNESQISDKLIINQGVDFIGEYDHIERITETAVGKVLMTLAYDYEFIGQVHIFTDNYNTANHWNDISKNTKLAKHFLSVKVSHIPREKNRRADQLGRTRMLLDMPISAYNEAVKNQKRVKELEKKVKLLEAQKNTDIVIPEVIVANQASYSHESKGKMLFFNNLFRHIRRWLNEPFGEKAANN